MPGGSSSTAPDNLILSLTIVLSPHEKKRFGDISWGGSFNLCKSASIYWDTQTPRYAHTDTQTTGQFSCGDPLLGSVTLYLLLLFCLVLSSKLSHNSNYIIQRHTLDQITSVIPKNKNHLSRNMHCKLKKQHLSDSTKLLFTELQIEVSLIFVSTWNDFFFPSLSHMSSCQDAQQPGLTGELRE